MKKIFVVLALMGSSLVAQNRNSKPTISPQEKMEKLVVELNLDAQQKDRVQIIQREYHLKLGQLKETDSEHQKLTHTEIATLRKERSVKMRAILTQEQFEAYKRMQSRVQMNKKRPNKRGKHGTRRKIN
ncbi:MAG: hypothetical protein QMC03_06745 [Flavobacteriales bacterium]|jgi:hypothetical protein|tara:strand:+ start:273 stop:659 length:387 start_codon:yes stop_codon:yes gene_type:complete